jgi:hypothetical protein
MGLILVSVLIVGFLGVYLDSANNNRGRDVSNQAEQAVLFVKPAFAQSMSAASTFLENQAGISLYVNIDRPISLVAAKAANWSGIEQETADYIVGSLRLPGLGAEEDVHCFVHKTGWIVTYYGNGEPITKMVDWNFWSQSTSKLTKNKLKAGLDEFSFLGPMPAEKYYHFNWPNATKCMLAFRTLVGNGEHSLNITIPSDIEVYERSWSHYAQCTHQSAWPGTVYSSYLKIDGYTIDSISGEYDPATKRGTLIEAQLFPGASAHIVGVSSDPANSYLYGVCIGLVYEEP